MARAKGRDVVLDLMDTVAALQQESATLRDQFGLMREQLSLFRDDVKALDRRVGVVESHFAAAYT